MNPPQPFISSIKCPLAGCPCQVNYKIQRFVDQLHLHHQSDMKCLCTQLLFTWSDSKVMRLIFSWLYWQYCSPLTWTAFDLGPSSILTCSGKAVQCLSVEEVLDMSGSVGEPRLWKWKHGTSRNVMPSFFVLNSVTLPPQHMVYFSWPLEMMQCQEHKPFRWHKMFSEGRTLVEDEQHNGRPSATGTGDNTARVRELVRADRRLTVRMITDGEHEPGNRTFDTDWRIGDEKNLWQDGTQESHRATAGCAVERSFWHPNALRWGYSLLTHLISHLATSFCFKK